MRPSKAQFVSACQQLLALGAVFAVLAPAANVVSLEVITTLPREGAPTGHQGVPLPGRSSVDTGWRNIRWSPSATTASTWVLPRHATRAPRETCWRRG